MPVTVTFTPTNADLVRAGYVGLQSRPLILWSSLVFFVIFPWVLAAGFAAAHFFGAPISWVSILVLVAVPPVAVIFFALLPVRIARGARPFQGTHTYHFSETGIQLQGPGFDNRLEWHALTNCFSGKFGLLFSSGKFPMLSIPARVLSANAKLELLGLASAQGITIKGA
jgi:hypothetical protein